ncbi:sugar phosphate isomerase/epimerase family protein [Cohnella faecalis]|uniref:Sugar phosphate isomerase/epimerase n=1 Tax=Cohnella faecalis TaxID=2315694 RepID=A0A398CEE0_9BACL|nr:sugar phosphate isomerase/epimerase family protein [Cohnella faecalis]RIE01073.1 sugar phosphate isomerase/epimerase [Cohnella faecalis]
MNIAISQITTLPASTAADLEAFSQTGWQAVELAISKVDRYLAEHSVEQLGADLTAAGLVPIAAIGLASSEAGLLLSTKDNYESYERGLERQLAICKALGIKNLGIGADPASKEYEGWYETALANLRKAGDLAERYEVRLGLEFMSLAPPIGPFILENMDQTLRIVEDIDHPSIGYNLDLFHFYRSGGSLEDIEALPVEKLFHVHLCDLPHLKLAELDDSHRLLPGEGILPMDKIVQVLRDKGYTGYLALELLNQELWDKGPIYTADRGMHAMQKYR